MVARLRQQEVTFDAVTRELWSAAENGDVRELTVVLSRGVDVDARNEHGMTALMRAARCGHAAAVRVLLEHGADPNVPRNDRFTSLALAAFFGHTETVRILIEHGAKTEVVTRSGTSPRMWARARTFSDVVRSLETPAPAPVSPVPVIKTLKNPPEIWDLVHEVPSQEFNPRSAFVARITSMRKTFAVGACAVVLLVVGGGIGALMLRNSQARDLPPEIPPAQIAAETTVSRTPQAQPVVESPPVEVVNDNHVRAVPNKARMLIRQPRTVPVFSEAPVVVEPSREVPAVATPVFESPKPAAPAVKTNPDTALSPHLITPPKNAPAKGKVIQWP